MNLRVIQAARSEQIASRPVGRGASHPKGATSIIPLILPNVMAQALWEPRYAKENGRKAGSRANPLLPTA